MNTQVSYRKPRVITQDELIYTVLPWTVHHHSTIYVFADWKGPSDNGRI